MDPGVAKVKPRSRNLHERQAQSLTAEDESLKQPRKPPTEIGSQHAVKPRENVPEDILHQLEGGQGRAL